ncbi:MAG TPA: efflux transporter periplasmic adaptor subunit [Thioalkalivibrio sp.]|nr:efflux transporter periplasmic adaptor subunit [Thioalkalivibrio sp.]
MNSYAKNRRLWPVGIALAVGLAFVVTMVALRQGPPQDDTARLARAVRVIEVESVHFFVEARGFGTVRPTQSFQGVANVSGPVRFRHPRLMSGNIIPAGTRLLEIDPSRYELAVAAAQADLGALDTELAQLEQEQQNTRDLLVLERRRLTLAEREMARARQLAEQGVLAATLRDEQERATLQQRQAVQGLENGLRLIPSRIAHLEARRDRARTALAQAERDLTDTRFDAPYDLRVGTVEAELHQHVSPGQRLFSGDGIDRAEAVTQIPLPELRRLLALVADRRAGPDGTEWPDIAAQVDLDALEARLTLVGTPEVRWDAQVLRMANGINPDTRTVQVVLGVDEPYRRARPPERPPLVRGMYVEGVLGARTPEPVIVIPRAAVHGERVYLVGDEDRLERRRVEVGFTQRDLAVINAGLRPGDRVILDDLTPAIEGMRLEVSHDEAAARELVNRAKGVRP